MDRHNLSTDGGQPADGRDGIVVNSRILAPRLFLSLGVATQFFIGVIAALFGRISPPELGLLAASVSFAAAVYFQFWVDERAYVSDWVSRIFLLLTVVALSFASVRWIPSHLVTVTYITGFALLGGATLSLWWLTIVDYFEKMGDSINSK